MVLKRRNLTTTITEKQRSADEQSVTLVTTHVDRNCPMKINACMRIHSSDPLVRLLRAERMQTLTQKTNSCIFVLCKSQDLYVIVDSSFS